MKINDDRSGFERERDEESEEAQEGRQGSGGRRHGAGGRQEHRRHQQLDRLTSQALMHQMRREPAFHNPAEQWLLYRGWERHRASYLAVGPKAGKRWATLSSSCCSSGLVTKSNCT